MFRIKSLNARIILQFLVIVVPLALVLIYQAAADYRRTAQLEQYAQERGSMMAARDAYKRFVEGVVDAVDSGALSSGARQALADAQARLPQQDGLAAEQGRAALRERLVKLNGAIGSTAAIAVLLPLRRAINETEAELSKVALAAETREREVITASIQAAHRQIYIVAAALAATLLITALFVFFMIRQITQPLAEAESIANRIAAGEIRSRIEIDPSRDLGNLLHSLQTMNSSLYQVLGSAKSASAAVTSFAGDLHAGNQELETRNEQQAAALEQTAASMEQMSSVVRETANHARQSHTLSVSTASLAAEGGQSMLEVETAMGEIASSAKRIVDIIGLIDSIAFQTNILAINAAVEAARAGAARGGFSVVASEVRSLAQRSGEAASDIKKLVANAMARIDYGNQQVAKAGAKIKEIVAAAQSVSALASQISTACSEQSAGVEQINGGIANVERALQQNAQLVTDVAAAAGSLMTESDRLDQAIGAFDLVDSETAVQAQWLAREPSTARARG